MEPLGQLSNMYRISLLIVVAFILFSGCKSEPAKQEPTVPQKEPVSIPSISKDSAYTYVEKQVSFGTRVVGSPGHAACKNWIVDKLTGWGVQVTQQTFEAKLYTGDRPTGTNIIGKINPTHKKRVVLAAHWDTRHIGDQDPDPVKAKTPILGADDGGSGVAVLLEIARTIQAHPIDLGIDLVFFDAEDHGQSNGASETYCLGSQFWSTNFQGIKPEYGILLDMVGAKGASFRRDATSMQYAGHVANKVWNLATSMGYGNYFIKQDLGAFTDDHTFVNKIARIPMIDICNRSIRGFGTHWHTHNDNINIIDRSVLRVVGQVVLATLYKESTGHI